MECACEPVGVNLLWEVVKCIGLVGGNGCLLVVGKQCHESIFCSFPGVVSNAGFESNCNHGVRNPCEQFSGEKNGIHNSSFNDWVGEQIINALCNGFRGCFAVNEKAVNGSNLTNVDVVICGQLTANDITADVLHTLPLTWGNLYSSDWHGVSPARWAN